ncbi:MAG: Cell division coordinator CpoB [Chlamydiae bacterium]|nr:Cell division coordinator CpoB [Chlamydiota bacterium]
MLKFYTRISIMYLFRICAFLFVFLTVQCVAKEALQMEHVDSKLKLRIQFQAYAIEAEEGLQSQDYRRVKSLYIKMLDLDPKNFLTLDEYQDFLISYAYSAAGVNHFNEAEQIIGQLDIDELSKNQRFRKELLEAKLAYAQGQLKFSLYLLNEMVDQHPLSNWPIQDRTFYMKVSSQVKKHYENIIEQADSAFNKQLYNEAVLLYEELIQAVEQAIYTSSQDAYFDFACHLGHCEFFLKNYSRSRELFVQLKQESEGGLDHNSLYHLILASIATENFKEALNYCTEYLNQGPHHSQDEYQAIQFEIAHIYYLMGEFQKAQTLFTDNLNKLKSTEHEGLSRVYIAKILIQQKEYSKVEFYLNPNHFDLSKYPHLKSEWAYLRAEAFFQKKEYNLAIAHFEESLAQTEDGYNPALYHLALSYYEVSQKEPLSGYLIKAENCLNQLKETNPSDKVYITLAKVLISKYKESEEEKVAGDLQQLFNNCRLENISSKLEMGLLQASVTENNLEKEAIYAKLCMLNLPPSKELAKLAYIRAYNLFKCMQSTRDEAFIEKLNETLETSWSLFQQFDTQKIAQGLKIRVLAAIELRELDCLKESYQFLETFPSKYEFCREVDYYKALLASKLMLLDNENSYLEEGIHALDRILLNEAQTELAEQALYLMGTLHYQNKDYSQARHTFLKLIEGYPLSKWTGDAWYWAAECHDLQSHDPNISKAYRKKVFENHPNSAHAAESYFYYFPFESYLSGDVQAMEHLENMENKFKDSPLIVVSYYLRGIQKSKDHYTDLGKLVAFKDDSSALSLFEQAKETFLNAYIKGDISSESQPYLSEIYHRSQLASAQTLLSLSEKELGELRYVQVEQAIEIYKLIIEQFESKENPLVKELYCQCNYPEILEEAEFGLAMALIRQSQLSEGEDLLHKIIKQHQEAKMDKNYYCSRAWYELSLIAMARESYEDALNLLVKSQRAVDNRVTIDQKIELCIQESLCYRFLNKLDLAMLTLSKIINEEEDSELKIKAMYLRAEIYEIQGKTGLAQKQLESAAKKGGGWAKMSQDRLMANYEIN